MHLLRIERVMQRGQDGGHRRRQHRANHQSEFEWIYRVFASGSVEAATDSPYDFSGAIILAAIFATKRRGASRSLSTMNRFLPPEITQLLPRANPSRPTRATFSSKCLGRSEHAVGLLRHLLELRVRRTRAKGADPNAKFANLLSNPFRENQIECFRCRVRRNERHGLKRGDRRHDQHIAMPALDHRRDVKPRQMDHCRAIHLNHFEQARLRDLVVEAERAKACIVHQQFNFDSLPGSEGMYLHRRIGLGQVSSEEFRLNLVLLGQNGGEFRGEPIRLRLSRSGRDARLRQPTARPKPDRFRRLLR